MHLRTSNFIALCTDLFYGFGLRSKEGKSMLNLLDFTCGCLLACLDLDLDCRLLVGAWKLDWNMNSSMDITVVVAASRISHPAPRILHPAFRLSSCLSRSPPFCTSASLLSRNLIAALPPFPPLQSLCLCLCLRLRPVSQFFSPVWSNSKKGGVQGHRPCSAS